MPTNTVEQRVKMANDSTAVPGRAAPSGSQSLDVSSLWLLFYRHGTNPNCQKLFQFTGDLVAANSRGREHCEMMGFAFIYVKPFLSNLEADERRKLRQFGQPSQEGVPA